MTPRGKVSAIALLAGSMIFVALSVRKSAEEKPSPRFGLPWSQETNAPTSNRLKQTSAPAQKTGAPLFFPGQSESKAAALRTRFLRLSTQDKYAAIDAALRLGGTDRRLALATLAAAWKNDLRQDYRSLAAVIEGADWLNRHPTPSGKGEDRSARLMKLGLAAGQPGVALLSARLANRLLEGNDRTAFLELAASALAGADPSTAYALGDSLTGSAREAFLGTFLSGWARQDPEAAAQWVAGFPFGEARQSAIQKLGSDWAHQDTAAALAWANNLSEPSERQGAVAAIQSVAPIGVGIELRQAQKGGYPVAGDLVASGPAAQAGSIRPGDQIVAVADAGNAWIGTANLPLSQVISMIRGTAGAPVQLRLLPEGATDPSQARTVTIVRRQLLFKRARSGS